jgi:hypothetical protein
MPSSSEKQRNWIYYQRSQYKTKSNTPENMRWIWEKGWEEIEETKQHKIYKRRFGEINTSVSLNESFNLYEKTYNIQEDINFIYDKAYKRLMDLVIIKKATENDIEKAITQSNVIIKSSELKSKDCNIANSIDPVIISCQYFKYKKGKNYYDSISKDNLILITPDINLIYSIVKNNYVIDYNIIDNYHLDNKDINMDIKQVVKDFERLTKMKIAHELTHWVDDIFHGKFVNKRQLKIKNNLIYMRALV